MSEGLDIIKARHTRDGDNVVCWFCEMPWPCDTATVLAALDRSEASQRALREALIEARVNPVSSGGETYYSCWCGGRDPAPFVEGATPNVMHRAHCVLATAAPPAADDARPLPTTESLTRSDPDVTGWTGESDEATP